MHHILCGYPEYVAIRIRSFIFFIILKEGDILPGKKINFSLNNDKNKFEILIDETRKTYTSEKYDISIIEMNQNDGIKMDSFLEIDSKVWKNNPITIFT